MSNKQDLSKKLLSSLGLKNVNQLPMVEKVVFNIGLKKSASDSKALDYAAKGLSLISGQKPVKTMARKSIAGFKIRAGTPIGVKVTLRRKRMTMFIEKLVRLVIPAIRNFRGLKSNFDDSGNYNLGIKDWMIFPEINYDNFQVSKGMNITIHIKNGSKAHSFELLKEMGFPFAVSDK